ncbi:MAG: GUN4 domain-containing protein [Hormoscilla sp.]
MTAEPGRCTDRALAKVSEVAAKPEEQVPARYHKLRDLLSAGKWEEADRETFKVMLQVADREKEGWLEREANINFPCEDLRAIDKLWVKSSNGRFGFSVQKRIWLEVGGSLDYETASRLADRVGWREKGEWQLSSDLTYSLAAPAGHLPARAAWGGIVGLRGAVCASSLAHRCVNCNI